MSNVFTIFGTLFKITHPHMCIFYKRNFHVFFSQKLFFILFLDTLSYRRIKS